ncbi:FecR family protein [Chitinophaga sp. XS-30]|uniref:FecR family protein n=1 Tax=Chitinophaga sp. XS-30 TaxID=2604421 RepID=UPI0011DE2FA8|nr:FecR domain-containing protein [Chitinophaga sp. XS-30]QEH43855.1 DUF4974 domain-containing protein [Chitinophaga sp. XS-30]
MASDYTSYDQQDFLEDKFFIQWVKYGTPETEAFWNSWIAAQPHNLAALRGAEEQLKHMLSVRRIDPEPSDEEEVWNKIITAIDESPAKVVRMTGRRKWLIAASIAAVILFTGAFWLLNRNTANTVVAGYGQLVTVSLPDASIVKLNANSQVIYLRKWDNGQPREVYLKGEAFFSVRHINSSKFKKAIAANERFIVHTNRLRIEVLGTEFNVKERRGKTTVSLEKGSIKVQLKADSLQQLFLQPGDLAEYDEQTGTFSKTTAPPAFHKDWTERKMLTSNTTVAEIVTELEDIYGYTIILEDPELANRKIDGTIPLKNESNVLFILSNILNVDIEKKNNQMIFKTRK